jgi:hypothetical protein
LAQPWFRFYHEVLDDPKVQTLPPELFKFWTNTLCLACRNNGFLPDIKAVSFAFRCDEKYVSEMLQLLDEKGLLDKRFGKLSPHKWFERQYKSDTSTERVKRHREKKRNVSPPLAVTPPEQIQNRTDTDTEQKGNKTTPSASVKRGGTPDPAADSFAEKCLEYTRVPYDFKTQDFVILARLRKSFKIGTKETPEGWEESIVNYFGSALGKWTIADLANRYQVFRNSAVDRYGKPINHVNGGNGNGNGQPKDRQQLNFERAEALDARFDSKDRSDGKREFE